MNLSFSVDQKSGIPIYIQIMDQIKHLIATGALEVGQQLPTIRELAVDLTVNLHTVSHAYAELEREGFLSIERGRGTFVTNTHIDKDLVDLRMQKLHALVSNMLAEVVYLGYEPDEVVRVLDAYVEQWRTASRGAASENVEE